MDRSNGEQNGEEIAALGLFLSEFHDDDGQIFTSEVFDFLPLYTGILNLPANLRRKFGLESNTTSEASGNKNNVMI